MNNNIVTKQIATKVLSVVKTFISKTVCEKNPFTLTNSRRLENCFYRRQDLKFKHNKALAIMCLMYFSYNNAQALLFFPKCLIKFKQSNDFDYETMRCKKFSGKHSDFNTESIDTIIDVENVEFADFENYNRELRREDYDVILSPLSKERIETYMKNKDNFSAFQSFLELNKKCFLDCPDEEQPSLLPEEKPIIGQPNLERNAITTASSKEQESFVWLADICDCI